jgi:hypothetical protein
LAKKAIIYIFELKTNTMTIKIEPIEGARLITKIDVEKRQKTEDIDQITEEEWQEAINVAQNTENLLIQFKKDSYSFYPSFRKNILAVFYKYYPEMVDLNTENLDELYDIISHHIIEKMSEIVLFVTGKLKAVKSEFNWDKNQSENLETVLNITKDESKQIDMTAPTFFIFNTAKLKDAITRQKGKKFEKLKFIQEEAESIIKSFSDACDLRKKNALITKELYSIIVSGVMDVFRYNISHFSDKEITSTRHVFIQHIYDFMSDIINKVNSFGKATC